MRGTIEHDQLIRDVLSEPRGEVSRSIYETARVVSLAPWLANHGARVELLCRGQAGDGGWGGPDGYTVVPTLSATEALLTCLGRRAPVEAARAQRLARAAVRGLQALHRSLNAFAIPDTIAVELIVPALIARINEHLDGQREPLVPFRLRVPTGLDPDAPAKLGARLVTGSVPRTWWASMEVLPTGTGIAPVDGSVACSPAATAAWLLATRDRRPETGAAVRYLDDLQAAHGGALPAVSPITYFEVAWVLTALPGPLPAEADRLLSTLDGSVGADGAPAAPGLPADCDDTAVVLDALQRAGRPIDPACLLAYRTDTHFSCFPGERTPSTSTNAHALETIERHLRTHPQRWGHFGPAAAAVAGWLLDRQDSDGAWHDKWHASPYYATVCAVQALALRRDDRADAALHKAVAWVLATQRADGSWGRFAGTVEETAYAVRILTTVVPGYAEQIRPGAAYLRSHPSTVDQPGLWHAKDLYAPGRVIRAARLAALAAASSTPPRGAVASPPPSPPVPRQRPATNRPARRETDAAAPPR